jgi:hypothetical protein
MSAPETPKSSTHPSRAFTIWTAELPEIVPPAPIQWPPSRAFTLWPAAAQPKPAAAVSTPAKSMNWPPSRAFTIWTAAPRLMVPPPARPAPAQAAAAVAPATATGGAKSGIGALALVAAFLIAVVFGYLASEFRKDLKKLRASTESLKSELLAVNNTLEKQRKDLAAAEKKLASRIDSEKAATQSAIAAAKTEMTAQITATRDSAAAVEKKLAETEKTLTAQIADLKTSAMAAEKKLADSSQALAGRIDQLNTEKAALAKSIADADKRLSDQLAKLNTEKAALDQKVAAQATESGAAKVAAAKALADGLAAGKTETAKLIDAEKARIDGILTGAKTLEAKLTAEKAALTKQLETLNADLQSTRASFDKIVQALSGLGGAPPTAPKP